MGPFPPFDRKKYILVTVDYVSKWIEAIPTRTNDHREVLRFVTRYGKGAPARNPVNKHQCSMSFS